MKEFKKFNIDNKKLISIPNGFLEKYFKPIDQEKSRVKLNLPKNKKILLNIANLEEYKGQKYLIEALKEVVKKEKNIIVYILGRGSLKKKLNNLIKEYKLEKYVILAGGNKPFEELPLWYNACDLFVLPSLSEGNPTVMFEALGCGKPFIGTNVGGIPEIINNQKYGLLSKPKDVDSLVKNIIIAINKNWDKIAIINYSEKFSWYEIVKKIKHIYQSFLKDDLL